MSNNKSEGTYEGYEDPIHKNIYKHCIILNFGSMNFLRIFVL